MPEETQKEMKRKKLAARDFERQLKTEAGLQTPEESGLKITHENGGVRITIFPNRLAQNSFEHNLLSSMGQRGEHYSAGHELNTQQPPGIRMREFLASLAHSAAFRNNLDYKLEHFPSSGKTPHLFIISFEKPAFQDDVLRSRIARAKTIFKHSLGIIEPPLTENRPSELDLKKWKVVAHAMPEGHFILQAHPTAEKFRWFNRVEQHAQEIAEALGLSLEIERQETTNRHKLKVQFVRPSSKDPF
ncbi:hypothetical protein AUJ65_05085 [Candidatus Micrarchaeota archaeon CG1_02_51_15]|nr:MAG: hypothetical protein AUJ65_05085 [Candidatus Micrarchaeota archaeon CG1_02_51_15]